jgi:hypothetical protein
VAPAHVDELTARRFVILHDGLRLGVVTHAPDFTAVRAAAA